MIAWFLLQPLVWLLTLVVAFLLSIYYTDRLARREGYRSGLHDGRKLDLAAYQRGRDDGVALVRGWLRAERQMIDAVRPRRASTSDQPQAEGAEQV